LPVAPRESFADLYDREEAGKTEARP
jgi:hypothetical protein